MSWFNTLLNTASVGLDIVGLSKIEQIRQQGETRLVEQIAIKEIRDQVYELKRLSMHWLNQESSLSNFKLTGLLGLLKTEIDRVGITPDLFGKFEDKEYCANTLDTIQGNFDRLYKLLSNKEKEKLNQIQSCAQELPKYDYYVKNYTIAQQLWEANKTLPHLALRNYWGLKLIYIYLLIPLSIIPYVGGGLLSLIFGDNLFFIGVIFGVLIDFLLLIEFWSWLAPLKYRKARKTRKKYKERINLEYFLELDMKYHGEYQAIQEKRKKANIKLDTFLDTINEGQYVSG